MNRKVIGILLLLFSVVFLSACGGGATPTPTTAPTEPPPTEAPEPEAVETEAAEADVDATAEGEATEAAEDEEADEADVTEEADAEEASADGEDVEAAADGTVVVVNFPNNSARSGPGTSFDVVAPVTQGMRLPVIARTEATGTALWYLVALESGEEAWVWSRVVTLEPSDAEVEVAATVPSAP